MLALGSGGEAQLPAFARWSFVVGAPVAVARAEESVEPAGARRCGQ